jgi:hypothetical protein
MWITNAKGYKLILIPLHYPLVLVYVTKNKDLNIP